MFSFDHLASHHTLKLTTKELQVTKIMIANIYLARHQSITWVVCYASPERTTDIDNSI